MLHAELKTWSGQSAKDALHWDTSTKQRLGSVIYLLRTGKAQDREAAYQEFVELKRWFIVEEFDDFIKELDDYREKLGFESLSSIMRQIKKERLPSSNWQALDGKPQSTAMLPCMTKIEITLYDLLIKTLKGV